MVWDINKIIKKINTTVKHGKNLTAIECSAVFMEQYISNIRVSIFEISKVHTTLAVQISNTFWYIEFKYIFTEIMT